MLLKGASTLVLIIIKNRIIFYDRKRKPVSRESDNRFISDCYNSKFCVDLSIIERKCTLLL